MNTNEKVAEIAVVLQEIRRQLARLDAAGQGIPAVEKNAFRMQGTLHALDIQFADLHTALTNEAL